MYLNLFPCCHIHISFILVLESCGANTMTEAAGSSLSAVDYVVIVAVLLVSASIGVYFRLSGGRQKTTKVGCP